MITYVRGDIFKSPARIITNTVNTVGVMGKGIALEFKNRYPHMFKKYKEKCENNELFIGELCLINEEDHQILLFPTKENWRNKSKIEYIEAGLKAFVRDYAAWGMFSVAFPKLGCGNGGLDWDDVRCLMEKYLSNLPIEVYIYVGNLDITVEKPHRSLDVSHRGLVTEITRNCTLEPLELSVNGEKWKAKWEFDENISFTKEEKGDEIRLDKEGVGRRWDHIKDYHIVEKKNDTLIDDLFYSLVARLGYLSEIEIIDDEINKPAFQLDSGAGRVFYLNEGVPR